MLCFVRRKHEQCTLKQTRRRINSSAECRTREKRSLLALRLLRDMRTFFFFAFRCFAHIVLCCTTALGQTTAYVFMPAFAFSLSCDLACCGIVPDTIQFVLSLSISVALLPPPRHSPNCLRCFTLGARDARQVGENPKCSITIPA